MSLQYGLIIVYIMNKKVVFFDSGIGGLSTLAVTLSLCPTLSYIYVADNKHAPYGKLPARTVTKYVCATLKPYLNRDDVGAIVLACNTATNCAIEKLRTMTNKPIIGTEPAVVPASKMGKVLVFATPTTVMQPKFEALCGEAAAPLAICPCPTLATDIERFFEAENPRALTDIILSIKRASSGVSGAACVCLGCTHYSIIKGVFARIFGVPVVDGNLGVANQLLRIIGSDPEFASSVKSFPQIITTAQSKINYQKVLSKLI